jgi:hypothetical protein
MDWSANKKQNGHASTYATNNIDEFMALIERSRDTYQFRQGMVLLYAGEMTAIAQKVVNTLKLAGLQEVSNPSLLEANKKIPSLIAKCFAPKLMQEPSFSTCKDRKF